MKCLNRRVFISSVVSNRSEMISTQVPICLIMFIIFLLHHMLMQCNSLV
jgi:hypothetical protein